MRHLLTILASLLLCSVPLHAQTMKALMFNSTNGQVVANTGTNVLTFTNSIKVGDTLHNAYGVFYDNENGAGIDLEQGQIKNSLGNIVLTWSDTNSISVQLPLLFNNTTNAATTRTNLSLGLPALTNTSNVTMMRALSGSTNTNHPYSGSISVVGTNNTNTLVFSNGILQSVQ